MSVTTASGVSATLVQPAIFRGAVAPSFASLGDLWEDTSGSVPVLKHCTTEPNTWTAISSSGAYNPASVAITGGTIDGVPLGTTTPAAGTFTTLIGGKNQANYGQLTGGATTKAVEFKTIGSDSNVSYAIETKGTGAIDLAAGSSGVNISNGGTVTAITRTAAGTGYTSPPTVAITAPTTAGGVQATATVNLEQTSSTGIIAGGGTGYTVNDVITVSGGTQTTPSSYTVTSVSGGVITGLSLTQYGSYSAIPSNPVSTTGGTGTGATLNITWQIKATFTITNAGSGYVEQPTVSFSGGGGSGAAAYAKVGGDVAIKGLGTNINFQTPQGSNALQVRDSGIAAPVFLSFQSSSSNAQIYTSGGTGGNAGNQWFTLGTGSHSFGTNVNAEQLRVSHTASAVNYVQVTGAATGSQPKIQSAGNSIALALSGNGANGVTFWSNSFTTQQFAVTHTASAANYLSVTGAIATAAPVLSAQGSDTNIDLALTPKGTGNVTFGTYTAGVLTPTGYITIKDSGGTVRRLLVG